MTVWLELLEAETPRFENALCAEIDGELFFPEKGGSTKGAKFICGRCDDREPCLEWALQHGERYGIWGGASERDRRRLIADRGITPTPIGGPDLPRDGRTYTAEARQEMAGRARENGRRRWAKPAAAELGDDFA